MGTLGNCEKVCVSEEAVLLFPGGRGVPKFLAVSQLEGDYLAWKESPAHLQSDDLTPGHLRHIAVPVVDSGSNEVFGRSIGETLRPRRRASAKERPGRSASGVR
jgi:hypothetical protein